MLTDRDVFEPGRPNAVSILHRSVATLLKDARCRKTLRLFSVAALAALSLLVWLYLLLAHGRFWQSGPELTPARPTAAPHWPQ